MPLPRATIRSVRDFARRHDLLRPGPLVVAASGGADSTALVLILDALAEELGLVLHLAHFDHRMRARAAAADAAFVSDLASRVGAPIRVGRATAVPKNEDEARIARYAFLRRTATAIGATAIATGHTRDDQAETVLLHATRGSGLAGLAAMRPSREGIVRPLLCVGRAETVAACAAVGITPRADPTNRDERYARNRIRRSVLPELSRINPRATEALARLSDVASEALTSLRAHAEALLDEARVGDEIDIAILDREPTLRSEVLALAWTRATGRVLSGRGRDALAKLAATHAGTASIDLPGGRAEREYARLRLPERSGTTARAARQVGQPSRPGPRRSRIVAPVPAGPRDARPLVAGREVEWDGWRLLLTRDPSLDEWPLTVTCPDDVADGLVVRARRPGDRMAGDVRRKLQDVLTDAKMPAAVRDRQPLVVTRAGEILWVPGVTTPSLSGRAALVARPPRDRAAVAPLEGRRGSGRSKGEGVEPERVASTQRRARKGRPG